MRIGNGIIALHTGRLSNGAFLATVDLTRLAFPDYQRGAIKKHVAKIADNWDNEFARPLLISLRDRQLNTFDGRQTSAAALEDGQTTLLAFIWDDWTYEREALAFFVFNDVPKRMNGWKKFSADMKAGNAANVLILETLHDAGLTTPFHPGVTIAKNADVPKSSTVQDVMRKGGLPLLRLFAKVMKNWKFQGVISETAKASDFGRALKDFLFKNQSNARAIVQALRVITPEQVLQLAKTKKSKGRIDNAQIRQAFETLTGLNGLRIAA
jgi:hypothetical protein